MGVARIFMKRCTKMGGYSMFHTSRKGGEMISSVATICLKDQSIDVSRHLIYTSYIDSTQKPTKQFFSP